MKCLVLTATLLALPPGAVTFGARYPAGSISNPAQAQAALKDSDAEMRRIQQDAKSREADCYRGLLVNSCRDDVRRQKELAEREVRRVQLDARNLQRRLEAEDAARGRAEKADAQAAQASQRMQKQESERADQAAREAKLKQRDANTSAQAQGQDIVAPASNVQKKESKTTPAKSAQQSRSPSQDPLTAAERADNALKFQQKQAQAAERAREQQAQREKNEQRRAERRKETEQREAEREALRQKAAQLPK